MSSQAVSKVPPGVETSVRKQGQLGEGNAEQREAVLARLTVWQRGPTGMWILAPAQVTPASHLLLLQPALHAEEVPL